MPSLSLSAARLGLRLRVAGLASGLLAGAESALGCAQSYEELSANLVAANAALDLQLIGRGGECVVYGSGAGEFKLPFFPLIVNNVGLQFFIVYNRNDTEREQAVRALTHLLEQGVLHHAIAERLPPAQIAQAHELVEQGRAVGNVVLAIP